MGFLQNSIVNTSTVNNPYNAVMTNAMLNGSQYNNASITASQNTGVLPGIQDPQPFATGALSVLGKKLGSNSSSTNAFFGKLNKRISDGFSSINSGITTALGKIDSEINSIFGQNQGKGGKSSVSRVLGSTINQKGFMGSISNGYKDGWSSIKNSTAIKTDTPDPISSAYAQNQKPPVSSLLELSSGTTGIAPKTLGSNQNQPSNYITGDVSTLKQRYGDDITGGSDFDFKNAGDTFLKSSVVSGMFSGVGGVVGGGASVLGGVFQGFSGTMQGVVGGVTNILSDGSSAFRGFVGEVSQEIFGSVNGLDQYYNSGLPSMADYNGNEIPGYGNGGAIGYGGCESIADALGGMGCETNLNSLSAIPYSALGSAMNALQELAAASGLTGLLQDIIYCKNMTEYNFQNLHQLFYQFSGQDIDVSSLAMGNLGLYNIGQLSPGGGGGTGSILIAEEGTQKLTPQQAMDKSGLTSNLQLLQIMVVNQNLTTTQLSTLKSVISNLGWQSYQAYTTGDTIGQTPVWNVMTLGNSLSDVSESLLSDYADVPYLVKGIEVSKTG